MVVSNADELDDMMTEVAALLDDLTADEMNYIWALP